MKGNRICCALFFALCLAFASCKSTNVYVKTSERLYYDGELGREEISLVKDGKTVSKSVKESYSANVSGFVAKGVVQTSDSDDYETTDIALYKNGSIVGEKTFRSKNGQLVADAKSETAGQKKSDDKNQEYRELADYGDFVYVEGQQKLQSFFVKKTEVTQAQYKEVMGTNPSKNQGDALPVESLSLFDALEFCNRVSMQEGRTPCYRMAGTTWTLDKSADGWRLLTDEEFLFATKGGKNSDGCSYSGSNTAGDVAWTKSNSGKRTHEVAKKKANALGIYDMSGNVWEWLWTDGGGAAGGGSAMEAADQAKVTSTRALSPSSAYADVGLRLARNATSQEKSAFAEKKKLSDKMPLYFANAFREISKKRREAQAAIAQQNLEEEEEETAAARNTKNEVSVEKVTVESTTNGKYAAYSFLGKPFVILGAGIWNVLKCFGYACVNFAGGYNLVSGNVSADKAAWTLPSYQKSKEKAAAAKEANKIQNYPEYHKAFTDNHIIVEKYDRKIDVEKMSLEDAEKIKAVEKKEYDNKMSVSLSAKSDAASTMATAGLIGTAVTIPVSVTTWIGGAAAGIYGRVKN